MGDNLPAKIEPKTGAGDALPALITDAGGGACFVWEEFFSGSIRNPHTRRAYTNAVRKFLAWCQGKGLELRAISPGKVGEYLDAMGASVPTTKLHLAAIRGFFDALVLRHVVLLNPAASVKAARYQTVEGKTPEITVEQARTLLRSIAVSYETKDGVKPHPVGLRDRAVIAILIYTAARIGAVAGLKRDAATVFRTVILRMILGYTHNKEKPPCLILFLRRKRPPFTALNFVNRR